MNPVLPHLRHNNCFILPEDKKETVFPTNSQYRELFPKLASYGPLIPPSNSIARAVMGNSNSCNDDTKTSMENENRGQQRRPTQPRSNLSALMEQQQKQQTTREHRPMPLATENLEGQQCEGQDEADSASGPSLWNVQAAPLVSNSQRPVPAPAVIPSLAVRRSSSGAGAVVSSPKTLDSLTGGRTRRCLSSKELGTLAPPSGSPYAFMLHQKEILQTKMAERLKQTRAESIPSHNSSPLTLPDDSSSSSRKSARMANEARNRRRAEHNQAVTNDLCEIVTDLFIAESKLLNPSRYGVDSSVKREQVLRSVERFVGSLPPRYALGAETPSEVLLHMRLMAAVRSDPTRPTVHIMNLDDDRHWNNTAAQQGRSRRLVTIACSDVTGLLEYVTKILATGGSHVLDADVMLSKDSIALDRFVVEMHGRLRLDKLASCIENFLEETIKKKKVCAGAAVVAGGSSFNLSSNSRRKGEFSGSLYFRRSPSVSDVFSPKEIQEEMNAAVPLTEMLASHSSKSLLPVKSSDSFKPLCRHLSMPPKLPSAFPPTPRKAQGPSSISSAQKSSDSLPNSNQQPKKQPKKENDEPNGLRPGSMRQRRPLVNRQGNSDLDKIGSDDDEGDDLSIVDYLTMDVSGSGVGNRNVPLIPFDELMLIETLGMGRVSTIYRAVWKHSPMNESSASLSNQMVALKVAMVNPATLDTAHVDEVRREADIAARLQHPNICDPVGVAADTECFCLAYEYCEGGSLLSLLSDSSRYYEYLPIALDIANGMAYLHSRNVIHRDLKPSNILLTRDHRAKIADFGMSVANTGQELTAETGTYRYMAPEVIRHESYSSNADVYSFGICLWQLITREVPFATMTPIQAAYAVAEGRRPSIPELTPHRLSEIITACWDHDSHKRPSFTYIAMALADYAKMAFSPANVGAQTLQIANEMLANVEGNSTVNVDFSTPVLMGTYMYPEMSEGDNIGLEI